VTRGRPVAARRAARVVLAAAALALAACSGAPSEPVGGPPTALPPPGPVRAVEGAVDGAGPEQAADPAFAAFYDQVPQWAPCGDGLECATLRVPVDWSAPEGPTLGLAVARRPAGEPGERLGALVVEPGGPGVSGVGWLRASADGVTTPEVARRYDVVAFDPRGVGASSPVDCLTDAELDAELAGTGTGAGAPGDRPAAPERRRAAEEFAAGCLARTGDLLAHVGTRSAARDLDVLRAALGQERLDYLGKSYGTLLGATYAELFPQRVGRVVLDGALDPAAGYAEVVAEQAVGLEGALAAYAAGCAQRRGCPLADDPAAAVGQVRDLLRGLEAEPLPTDSGRPLTASLAVMGVVAPLYDDAAWPALDQALAAALEGDGSPLLRIADAYAGRREDGSYATNTLEAFIAVTCLDRPVDASPAAVEAAAAEAERASPTFGRHLAGGEVQCGAWPVPAVGLPLPLTADGAAPILVVGTTGDPATPYSWAQELAAQLTSGRLLTWQGEGHTAYRRGSACVDGAVDGYLLDGVLPGEGATCTS
jgi:pimeloyl-ACP methyl ester carboxylesterase